MTSATARGSTTASAPASARSVAGSTDDGTPSAAAEFRRQVCAQLELLNARRLEEFLSRCHDGIVFDFPGASAYGGRHVGRDAVERLFYLLFQAVPDLRFCYRSVLVGPDRAAVEWTDAGTTVTGQPFRNAGVTVLEFRDGLLVHMRDHLDTEELSRQVGGRRSRARR